MRVVLQRVSEASVAVGGQEIGRIGSGYLVLLGVAPGDGPEQADWLADKLAGLRLFADADGKMNLDLAATGGSVMVISQFTLMGDASRGRRPSFINAAPPAAAEPLYEHFVARLRAAGVSVATGRFGADMQVRLVNDGPVTMILERNSE